MKLKILAIASVLALAGCYEPTPEQRQKLKNSLPEGCEVIEIGEYGVIDNLVIVNCEGRRVQASVMYDRKNSGKTTRVELDAVYLITPL